MESILAIGAFPVRWTGSADQRSFSEVRQRRIQEYHFNLSIQHRHVFQRAKHLQQNCFRQTVQLRFA